MEDKKMGEKKMEDKKIREKKMEDKKMREKKMEDKKIGGEIFLSTIFLSPAFLPLKTDFIP